MPGRGKARKIRRQEYTYIYLKPEYVCRCVDSRKKVSNRTEDLVHSKESASHSRIWQRPTVLAYDMWKPGMALLCLMCPSIRRLMPGKVAEEIEGDDPVFEVPVARHGLARKPAVAGSSTMSMAVAFPTG